MPHAKAVDPACFSGRRLPGLAGPLKKPELTRGVSQDMTEIQKDALRAARLPRGLQDRGPADIAATEKMLAAIRESYELYGFEAVETPFFEFTDTLGKFLPDQDRPNEGVFSFRDDDESWLSLRYDLTAPLARYVAENFDKLPKPYRSYRAGYVFRNEKPGPGRFRQFMQFDADTVGSASVAADAEMCMMAADTLEKLGIKRGDYVIKVNNRKVLDGVMEAIGLGGEENAGRRLTVLRAIDKLDRLGPEGVALLLGPGRKDESGDFTRGAGLGDGQIRRLMDRITSDVAGDIGGPPAGVMIVANAKDGNLPEGHQIELEGLIELSAIQTIVRGAGYGPDRIRIDPSVVRGLEYYTGPVFEAELTFEVNDEQGRPIRFGSVGGGGRYDGLVGRFRGENVPATGFSIGVSRLYSALKAINSRIVAGAVHRGPVVVLVLDKDPAALARYQSFVAKLRAENVATELYLGSSGMNAQMKYADKRGSVCAVIQGSNEREKGEVAIRDLILGAELAASTKDRADYLELRARAQFTVPETGLIAAVKEVLGRHR
ncbi:histidyl-tRNA synthetase [Methylocapsa palsarum]|uniref:Histidine--tRNA ligase n=2 Tax=Methylocapsa palsarum TaxID=1612308 RepID=A0A1I3WUY3_9HYPH|nr:histidyl-tRNA synthetase [Methylocapsa palsarum]